MHDSATPKSDLNDVAEIFSIERAICILGLVFGFLVWRCGLTSLDIYSNSFHVLYVRNEPMVLLLLFLALLLLDRYLIANNFLYSWPSPRSPDWLVKYPWLGIMALSVILLAWLGDRFVLHSFPLSNDEFLPRFQAQIFLSGKIKSILPIELEEFGKGPDAHICDF